MIISIIIPVYNEENFIKELLIRVNNIKDLRKEVIVINDKSTDNTTNILENECKSLYSKLINNEKNMGKGFSCRKGIFFDLNSSKKFLLACVTKNRTKWLYVIASFMHKSKSS